jgi:hypothetical protein
LKTYSPGIVSKRNAQDEEVSEMTSDDDFDEEVFARERVNLMRFLSKKNLPSDNMLNLRQVDSSPDMDESPPKRNPTTRM